MTTFEAPTAPTKKPGPALWLSILIMVAGVVVGVGALIAAIAGIVHELQDARELTAPGTSTLFLHAGDYYVYEWTGSSTFGTGDHSTTILPSDVTVTSLDGNRVSTFAPGNVNETIPHNGSRYASAVEFTAPSDTTYRITITSSTSTSVIVAPPLTDTIKGALGWFAGVGAGGLLFILGLVLLIVGIVRRSRWKRANAYAAYAQSTGAPSAYAQPGWGAAPLPGQAQPAAQQPAQSPAGWYPDPSGSGRQRYWDGGRWTEHLS